jgi:hypothetical protein
MRRPCRRRLLNLAIAAGLVAFALAVPSADAQDRRLNRELSTDRFGADYRALALPGDAACAATCEADPRCRAYTYALPGASRGAGTCWLKDGATQPSDAPGLVSGVRGGIGDVTVVVANLRGASPMETGPGLFPPVVTFQERARRLGAAIAGEGVVPDLVLITELAGWANCGGAGDYDQLDHLVGALRDNSGTTLRIAYQIGVWTRYGWVGQCSVFWAQAILYNPARIVNRTPEDLGLALAHDSPQLGLHFRRSLPVCNRGSSLTPIEALLDGPSQTDKCGRPTPSGPAYALGGLRASGARFSFRHDLRTSFDVFVVHPRGGAEATEGPQTADFIAAVQSPPFRTTRVAQPPIVAGDFNALARAGWPPGSTEVFAPGADVMQLSIGVPVLPPARQLDGSGGRHVMLPAGATECSPFIAGAFSDHCALLVRLAEVQPPPVIQLPARRFRWDARPERARPANDPYVSVCRRLPDLPQCQR